MVPLKIYSSKGKNDFVKQRGAENDAYLESGGETRRLFLCVPSRRLKHDSNRISKSVRQLAIFRIKCLFLGAVYDRGATFFFCLSDRILISRGFISTPIPFEQQDRSRSRWLVKVYGTVSNAMAFKTYTNRNDFCLGKIISSSPWLFFCQRLKITKSFSSTSRSCC